MHAQAKSLIDIISSQTQFLIPIYQRTYSWTEKECRCLWDDIIRAGKSHHIPSHFIWGNGDADSEIRMPLSTWKKILDGMECK